MSEMKCLMTLKELEVELLIIGGAAKYKVTEYVVAGWDVVRSWVNAAEMRDVGREWLAEQGTMPTPSDLIAMVRARRGREYERREAEKRKAEEARIKAEMDAMTPEQREAVQRQFQSVIAGIGKMASKMRVSDDDGRE